MCFKSESRSMQRKAREEVRRILAEQEKLSNELDEKMRKLDTWSRDLNKREVLTDQERQKLEEDKKKKDLRNESLLLASKEQKIADENVFRLVEEQKNHDVTDTDAETLTILAELFLEKAAQWFEVVHAINCIDVLRSFVVTSSCYYEGNLPKKSLH